MWEGGSIMKIRRPSRSQTFLQVHETGINIYGTRSLSYVGARPVSEPAQPPPPPPPHKHAIGEVKPLHHLSRVSAWAFGFLRVLLAPYSVSFQDSIRHNSFGDNFLYSAQPIDLKDGEQ